MSLNKVILVGNLGKDPEVRAIPNGDKVANFSIATTESYKNKQGEKTKTTEWHRIVMWRGLAEVAERFLKKGSMVCIEGKLVTRSWDKDGTKCYTTEIIASNMQMLGGGPSDSGSPSQPTQPAPIEDLPF